MIGNIVYAILAKVAYFVSWRAKSRNISVHIENASSKYGNCCRRGFVGA
jgi:hypothetical protein